MNSNHSPKAVTLPLNGAVAGRLVIAGGAANLTIRTDAALDVLCKAHFEGVIPECNGDEVGEVRIRYPRFGLMSWFQYSWEETEAEIVLKGGIPWEIEVRGGLAKLDADLRELQLSRFDVAGGISKGFLRLGLPTGEVPLHIGGGASKVVVSRPEETAARCRVDGGVAGLTFDGEYFGAIGGGISLETSDFADSTNRIALDIGGGASKVTLETWRETAGGRIEGGMERRKEMMSGYEVIRV